MKDLLSHNVEITVLFSIEQFFRVKRQAVELGEMRQKSGFGIDFDGNGQTLKSRGRERSQLSNFLGFPEWL
ncbi:MAG: hypothetical protein WCA35_28555 [Kovacikia sp.]